MVLHYDMLQIEGNKDLLVSTYFARVLYEIYVFQWLAIFGEMGSD